MLGFRNLQEKLENAGTTLFIKTIFRSNNTLADSDRRYKYDLRTKRKKESMFLVLQVYLTGRHFPNVDICQSRSPGSKLFKVSTILDFTD